MHVQCRSEGGIRMQWWSAGGATLIFETELLGINGEKAEA